MCPAANVPLSSFAHPSHLPNMSEPPGYHTVAWLRGHCTFNSSLPNNCFTLGKPRSRRFTHQTVAAIWSSTYVQSEQPEWDKRSWSVIQQPFTALSANPAMLYWTNSSSRCSCDCCRMKLCLIILVLSLKMWRISFAWLIRHKDIYETLWCRIIECLHVASLMLWFLKAKLLELIFFLWHPKFDNEYWGFTASFIMFVSNAWN